MADGDFLGGLFGGVKDAGSALYGLLGGPSGAPAAGSPTDILQQLSPEEQRRLTASTLGQLGASLLAAGQKQMPAQRAQALAQLGNIGPNIDLQLQRAVAVRNQQEALRRQNELFPMQKQQLQGQIATQQQQLAMQQRQAAMEIANLMRQIQTMESMGLDASGVRQQLQIAQQYAGGAAGGAGAPAPSIAPPTVPTAPAGTVGAPAPTGSTTAASAGQSMAPYAPSQAVSEAGYGGAAGQQASMGFQRVLSQLPYLSPDVVRSSLAQGGDLNKTMADLYKENEKAKQELFKFEGDIRKEYMPEAQKFANIQTTFKSMQRLANEPLSGPADLMLVTQLYKLYDPTSVVSQNESGQIVASGSVPDRIESMIKSLTEGGKMTQELKQKILDTARAKFAESYRDYNLQFNDATKRASEYGASMSRAVPDVRDPELTNYMQMITEKKMAPVIRDVDIEGQKYDARLGVDGKYYVRVDGRMRPINLGQRRQDEELQ